MPDLKKLVSKLPGQSDAQFTYMIARAAYDVAHEAAIAQYPERPPRGCTQTQFNNYVEGIEAIDRKHRCQDLFGLLVQAEDLLIEWARQSMRRNLGVRFGLVGDLFVRGKKASLVDFCLRYQAPEEQPKPRLTLVIDNFNKKRSTL